MNATPHSRLVPLLEQCDLDYATFSKRGRPPVGVREKRSVIVTILHESGCSWAEMIEITGLSNGSIQRLTEAKGCAAVVARRQEQGRLSGEMTRGCKRPWLTRQLKRQWADGKFDFHRGRVRSEKECQKLRQSWTSELRKAAASRVEEKVWGHPEVSKRLLAFHRSPAERVRRSRAQVERMKTDPMKYLRGRSAWVDTPKGDKPRTYVRSSYEVATIALLEHNPKVAAYEYERRFTLDDGRWVLPDFLVTFNDGRVLLVEVKAQWIFSLPFNHKVHRRLRESQMIANQNGWDFEVWAEKELGDALRTAA